MDERSITDIIGTKEGDVYWGPAEGSLLSDAMYYRQGEIPNDTTDPDEQDDLKRVDEYVEIGERLAVMRGQSIGGK